MRAAGGGGSGRALPWAACEGWEAKVAACTRLLAPHGGTVGVSEGEPLPEALLTVALLLLMPCEDFAALLRGDDDSDDDDNDGDGDGDGDGGDGGGEGKGKEGKGGKEGKKGKSSDSRVGMTAGGAAGGAEDGAAGGAAGEGGVARVPMLDSSVLEGEPLLAAAVVQAIVGAVAAAEKRYPAEPTAAPSAVEGAAGATGAAGAMGAAAEEVPGTRARRLVMARTMVCGELAALGATRRAALKLLVEIELGEDEEEGEEEDEEEGEEEGEEESEEEGDTHGAPPSAKVQRRA